MMVASNDREVVNLEHALEVAISGATSAGKLLRDHLSHPLQVTEKDASGDVVTDLDLASESLIISEIRRIYPTHRIISEESGTSGHDEEWTWIVDPLDGTNNLVIGLPALAVGIVLCHSGLPVVSVVHDPLANHTWSAIRGHGVWVSDPLRGGRCRRSAGAKVLAWTQGHAVAHDEPTSFALKLMLERGSQRVLQLWAPLVSWMMLVRGDIDGLVGYEAGPTDLYAGVLLAQEAGITVQELSGSPFDQHYADNRQYRSFLACRMDMVPTLRTMISDAWRLQSKVKAIISSV
jgi:myo-inositol-1(or 4)-monophosphatase